MSQLRTPNDTPPPLTRRCPACGYRYPSLVGACPIDGRPLSGDDPKVADLGSYRLIQRLGDGGMGTVYHAVHRRLGRAVAIKLLQKELTADRGIINRFFYEARAANTIRHPHVIEVYDFIEDGEDVYFVMELLIGQDVHDAVHAPGGGVMAPARAASILEQIASALDAAHARDIVHRDLKPENVFLDRKHARDFVKVIDFGIAKLERAGGRSTVEGAVLGTPEYIAPEQARGQAVDGRSDIYSLGCIGYEMLTARQAFGGGTRADVLKRQIHDQPEPIRSLSPGVPEALEAVIMRALAKDPAARPQTALAFAESIARAMGHGLEDSSSFHSVAPPRRRSDSAATASTSGALHARPVATPTPGPRAPRRRLWQSIGTFAGVTAALLAGGLLASRRHRHTPAPPPLAAPAALPIARPLPPAAPATATVLLQAAPDGVEIFDAEGRSLGQAPQIVTVPLGAEREVTFRKPGFQPLARRFHATADLTIAVRLDPEAPPRRTRRETEKTPKKVSTPLDSAAGTIDPFSR